jgi:hypothetical protein
VCVSLCVCLCGWVGASFGESVSASVCVGACVCMFLCLCLRLIDLYFGEMQMYNIFQLPPAKIQVGVFSLLPCLLRPLRLPASS